MTRPGYVPDDAENIIDHGAVDDDSDLDASTATKNLNALRDACDAAGEGGSIYVPSGTYYFGDDSRSSGYVIPGEREPGSISIYGDGPLLSTLALTEHVDPGDNPVQIGFNYDRNGDHDDVKIRDVGFDGNYSSVGDLESENGGSSAILPSGPGTFDFYNVLIEDVYSRGLWSRGAELTVDYCTFRNIGIGQRNDGGSLRHCISVRPSSDEHILVTNSKFENLSGCAINIRYSHGDVTVRNCYVSGTGANFCKLSAGNNVTFENIYHEANTEELEDLLDNLRYSGLNFIQSLGNRSGGSETNLTTNNVETRNHLDYAFQSRDHYENEPPVINWSGDNVAFHNSAIGDDTQVIRATNGGELDVNLQRVSVHDSNGVVFDKYGGGELRGSIETLHRDGNHGLGDTDDVAISTDNEGGDPFHPDVPSSDAVGIDASNNTSEDDASDDGEPLFDEWTPRWDSSHEDWEVVSDSAFDGDHALAFEHDGEDRTRYGLSCDEVGDPSDVEILDKFRVPEFTDDDGLGFHARVHLRSSYGSDDHDGYWVGVTNRDEAFRLAKYTGGSLTTLGLFGTPTEDTFFYRRFRAEGSEIKAKVWETTEPEPTEWDVEVTDSEHADGWVGLGSFDTGRVETDVFNVATGGDSARLPRSNDQPTVSWRMPADGKTVSNTVHVQIDASSPGDKEGSLAVEYRIDQGAWSATRYDSETGYYEAEWDSVSEEDGKYTFTARVTDSDGNETETAIDVSVENPVDVRTVEARDVSDRSSTLVGETVSLGGASSAEVGFERRETDETEWTATERSSVSSVGEFSTDVDDLEADTDYEFRAVVYLPETTQAEGRFFSTESADDEDVVPVIDQFDVRNRSNPVWSRFEVDWAVSHPNGDLDTVLTKLRYEGSVVAAESTTVSGETESYSHVMRVRGDVDEVVLSVNDTENTVATTVKKV